MVARTDRRGHTKRLSQLLRGMGMRGKHVGEHLLGGGELCRTDRAGGGLLGGGFPLVGLVAEGELVLESLGGMKVSRMVRGFAMKGFSMDISQSQVCEGLLAGFVPVWKLSP